MKNILYFILLLGFVGCSDFLEEASQDEIRPATADDLMQVMVGEAFPMSILQYAYDDILTDDVQCNGAGGQETLESSVEDMYPLFSWDDDMYEKLTHDKYNTWQICYNKIMGCNTVIDYMDRVSGEEKTKNNMLGQALVLRAYYYLLLVNYYALPYNYGDPTKNLGVPLKLEMEVIDGFLPRKTVAEVYEQMITDLEKGIKLLEENKMEMSLYKISALAGKAILCRVYLYMEDWDNALKYANMVLEEKPTLTSLASAPEDAMQYQGSNTWCVYNESTSDEIIWMYGGSGEYSYYPGGNGVATSPYTASDELMDLYEFSTDSDNHWDLRRYMYFKYEAWMDWSIFRPTIFPAYGFKGGKNEKWASHGIRTAELYLNRAEAYVRKFMETGEDNYRTLALADLNKLRENRYDTRNVAYNKVDYTNAEELLQFYKDERRRELCFEGHRWFDLRRYGMPELTHVYFIKADSKQQLVLGKEDPRYVLPIPQSALDRNPYLEQNKR
ncbi:MULTISPECIES: RagB/SusD family nutrient uptake outer membrane protein [Butyricimonas]|uniref:RagB/SusD family nutrient uptake outer membrane protein n=1 Tax=Butyricimonas TaxID=574697 RepID=UPI0007FB48CA|nr:MULTISPECIES: RagB/SusD family nutrient uptake outer membrane protein [Butyricimonas]